MPYFKLFGASKATRSPDVDGVADDAQLQDSITTQNDQLLSEGMESVDDQTETDHEEELEEEELDDEEVASAEEVDAARQEVNDWFHNQEL